MKLLMFLQVFALGQDDEDKEIWFRTGVTPSEPGGRTWQRIILEENPDAFDFDSPACLMSRASQPSLDSPDDALTMSDCFGVSQNGGFAAQTEETSSVPMMAVTSSSGSSVKEGALHSVETPPPATTDLGAFSADDKAQDGDCCKESSQNAASGAKFQNTAHSTQAAHVSSEHFLEKRDVGLQYESVAYVPFSMKSAEQTKSWQVVENSLQTSPAADEKAVEAEEAVESVPMIPLIPSSTAATEPSKNSLCNSPTCASKSPAERSAPMTSVSVCDGSGDIVKLAGEEGSARQPRWGFEQSAVFVGAHATSAKHETQETRISLGSEVDPVVFLRSSKSTTDPFDSLESGSSSDIICNFVTDLIEDDNGDDGKEEEKKKKSRSGVAQALQFADGDNGRVTFQDMHDQSEAEGKAVARPTSVPWISMGPSETFTGRVSSNSTPSSEVETIPAMTMTLAQPRYAWGWLAVSDFTVENPSTVPWLSTSKGKLEVEAIFGVVLISPKLQLPKPLNGRDGSIIVF